MAGFTLLAIVQTELRLLVRRLGFWLYMALLGALAITVILSAPSRNNWMDTLVQLVNNIVFFQFPLMALMVTPSVIRNKRQAGEWLWSTRLESPLLVLGQTLALALGLSIGLIVPLTVVWALLALRGTTALLSLPTFWFYSLTLLLPITLLEFGIVFSLSLWLRHTVLVALVTAGLDALLWLGLLMPTATLFTPLNHTLLTLRLDPVAGFGAERPVLFPLLCFYMALPVGALALSTWGLSQVDRRSNWQPGHGWRVGATMLVGIVSALLAFGFYQSAVRQRTVPPPVTDQVGAWSVVTASHTGVIVDSSIKMSAQLTLRNASGVEQSSLVLALNTGLQVNQASVNDQPVNIRREGEAIRLTFPGSPVDPGETVEVGLSYAGFPCLLREDYSLVTSTNGQSPTAFRSPVYVYLDSQVVLLQRDGDWRAWPLVAGPHLAVEGDELELTVHRALPIVSSGDIVEQRRSEITYRWLGRLPQFLLASAPYHVEHQADGTTLIAPLSDRRDAAHASTALTLRRTLADWLEVERPTEPHQAVILPYVGDVVVSGLVIGLPAIGSEWGLWDDVYETSFWSTRGLASALSRAWLTERITWPAGKLDTEGQLRSSITECDEPNETGQQRCVTRSLGGVNPQAPAGRLVEVKEISPLLEALSAVLGQQMTFRITGDQEALVEERRLWSALAAAPGELGYLEAKTFEMLSSRGLLPRRSTIEDGHEIANLVMEIDHLHNDAGDEIFAQFVQELIMRHPVGSTPLTDDAFWQVARQRTTRLNPMRVATHPCAQARR